MSIKDVAIHTINIILSEANSIEIGNKNDAIGKIEKVEHQIEKLFNCLIKIQEEHKIEIEKLNEELIRLNQKEVFFTSRENQFKETQTHLNAELSNLNVKKGRLDNDFNDLNRKINETNQKIRHEERKRENAVLDSIPIFGFFYAIDDALDNNEPERLIPGYSLVNGLMSVLTQEKEALEQRCHILGAEKEILRKQLDEVQQNLNRNNQSLNENAANLRKTKERIETISWKIKVSGEKTTSTKNILKNLKINSNKFLSFKNDLIMIKECISYELLDTNELRNFIIQIRDIKKEILELK